ncbi:MAG: phosphoribosylformylglycinamidine cyclo-ligase [Candidatus Thermoplasmatota archaeon]|nr:phosphoribosylformylglycinamidine cyclo-ligase [Candidatus Thermoplasmatota archaeon]
MKPRSYREAGVDILKEERSIASLVSQIHYKRQGLGSPIDLPGFFTALIDFGEWALTMNTDGVGTKLLVAQVLGKWDTVGIDCVGMNVNDTLCVGAQPLAMVDYFAVGDYDEEVAMQVGVGLDKGAEMADITIIGGELATIPEIVQGYDLVGTCLGCVRKNGIIDGKEVIPGQVVIGLRSSGLHSNGYTLARKLLEAEEIAYGDRVPGSSETWGEALLRPMEIYVREVLDALRSCRVAGLAHITGGGLRNLARIKGDLGFEIHDPFTPQPIFTALQEIGELDMKEMYSTFNMGQGFALVVEEGEADRALEILSRKREAKIIGRVVKGPGVKIPSFGISL